jgi:DNA repair exonuclease SbcCD ATPase subunit
MPSDYADALDYEQAVISHFASRPGNAFDKECSRGELYRALFEAEPILALNEMPDRDVVKDNKAVRARLHKSEQKAKAIAEEKTKLNEEKAKLNEEKDILNKELDDLRISTVNNVNEETLIEAQQLAQMRADELELATNELADMRERLAVNETSTAKMRAWEKAIEEGEEKLIQSEEKLAAALRNTETRIQLQSQRTPIPSTVESTEVQHLRRELGHLAQINALQERLLQHTAPAIKSEDKTDTLTGPTSGETKSGMHKRMTMSDGNRSLGIRIRATGGRKCDQIMKIDLI